MSDPLLGELMKIAKYECHLIPLTNWRARVYIVIGGTSEQHRELFKKSKLLAHEVDDLTTHLAQNMRDSSAITFQAASRPRRQFVCFPRRPDVSNPSVANVVAHELLHATIHILKHAGVRLNEGSEESFTYLLGHLVEQFWIKVPPITDRVKRANRKDA